MSSAPILLDKKSLEDGLCTLLSNYATDLHTTLNAPAVSAADLRNAATNLSYYLGHFHRHTLRRSTFPLKPSNLSLILLRTRNPIEFDENALTNSPKDWYQLVLSETEEMSGNVQILADGGLTKVKAEVLDAFRQEVGNKVTKWEEADRLLQARARRDKQREERKEREDLKKRRDRTKRRKEKEEDAVKESDMTVRGSDFPGDEMMMAVDDDIGMMAEGGGQGRRGEVVRKGRPNEQTRRARFEEMMDDSS